MGLLGADKSCQQTPNLPQHHLRLTANARILATGTRSTTGGTVAQTVDGTAVGQCQMSAELELSGLQICKCIILSKIQHHSQSARCRITRLSFLCEFVGTQTTCLSWWLVLVSCADPFWNA